MKMPRSIKIMLFVYLAIFVTVIIYNTLLNNYGHKITDLPVSSTYRESEIERLQLQNDELEKSIEDRDLVILKRNHQIDSFKSLQPLITVKYVKIYETIDHFKSNDLANITDSIFAVEGIGNK